MNDLIAYLLKVSIGTILMYLCFVLFFRKDTFYRRNRIILMLSIILPLLIPLIRITTHIAGNIGTADVPIPVTVINSAISAGETLSGRIDSMDYSGMIVTIWLIIAALLMLRTAFGLIKTASIIKRGDLFSNKFPKLVISDLDHPPFSFWPYAVIPRKIFDNGDSGDIIKHENAHIRQGHTFDLIAGEIYTSLFWFNPAAWLIKRSIKLNHEFLADHELTRHSANIKTYQYKLLNVPVEFNRIQLAHSFNNLIKNRIVMINKKQTSDYAALKNLLIIPTVALILVAFSCNNTVNTKDSANGQTAVKQPTEVKSDKPAEGQKAEEIFIQVDQMPVFPGGENAMIEFVKKEMKYPKSAQEKGIQGTVIVQFIIDRNGKAKNAKVVRGANPALDDEALRVVNLMPAWTPGKQGGRAVNVSYTVPLKFLLN